MRKVIKRDGSKEIFDFSKIYNAVDAAFVHCNRTMPEDFKTTLEHTFKDENPRDLNGKLLPLTVESIQDRVQNLLFKWGYQDVYNEYLIYRYEHKVTREYVKSQRDFIDRYIQSDNNANATIDDNSNVASKNIGTLNSEIHKPWNIKISRGMVMDMLKILYPDFDHKQYIRDLTHHIIYKHDESTYAGPIAPYCCSISMYPFITGGIKHIGGLSACPHSLMSFCGIYINLIFAISGQFAGAVATSEFFVYFDYFARKEWGDNYYKHTDELIGKRTLRKLIHQYFQQVVYSINQPAAARGMQSAFVNFSYFDKPFFDGMFGNFMFPDGTKACWESVNWLQRDFMQWFNEERLRCMLTFPVESFALVYKDGHFVDQDSADFVAAEYARGHSFFTYISDSVDSLSSCCRLKNKVQTKEFNFTNGNMGVMTGSKSVITLNLNRIVQDYFAGSSGLTRDEIQKLWKQQDDSSDFDIVHYEFQKYLISILERVYKYHTAYNESLWRMYDAHMLPVYRAGFISLDKQYLTIGINGLNEAAEFLGISISDNPEYSKFCQMIFSCIKDMNTSHNGKFNGHKLTFNTECVPAESLAAKNYNWDKADGYWVPEDRNLYASYIYLPSDEKVHLFEKIRMHGKNYIGDYLDGGSAAHLNLDSHLSKAQYEKVLQYAAEQGCQYLTFNIPNSECADCGYITKVPIAKCPKCGSEHIWTYDRVIGYLTRKDKWAEPRQKEKRVYEHIPSDC